MSPNQPSHCLRPTHALWCHLQLRLTVWCLPREPQMIYSICALALLNGVDAFSAGALPASVRAVVTRPSIVNMQVAEAEVASPVALAKVRCCSGQTHCQRYPRRALHTG